MESEKMIGPTKPATKAIAPTNKAVRTIRADVHMSVVYTLCTLERPYFKQDEKRSLDNLNLALTVIRSCWRWSDRIVGGVPVREGSKNAVRG